jgi:hypothetical protein
MSWSGGIDVRLYGEAILRDGGSDCTGDVGARITSLREIGSATVLLSSKPETLDDHWFADEMQALSASLHAVPHTLRVEGFEANFTAASPG